MIRLGDIAPARPPCSRAERAGAESIAAHLRTIDVPVQVEQLRAPTSPSWIPLMRSLSRVWAVALLAAYRPVPAMALAALAVAGAWPVVVSALRHIPLIGDLSQNVVGRIRGSDPDARPIVAVAHLDTHPLAASPMGTAHAWLGTVLGWLALAAAIAGRPGLALWRLSIVVVAVEGLVTLAWLARRELHVIPDMPDDNTSGLLALLSAASLAADSRPIRDVWIVATGSGTPGGQGMTAFLHKRPELRQAWVIEIDALGAGEFVAAPWPARLPRPGTPTTLVRAVEAAAKANGDPMTVRRVRRPHSDARAALRRRTAAITLTAGLRPPAGDPGPDSANAERAALIVDRLARTP